MPKVCPQAVLYRQIKLGRIKVNHCSSELHRFWSKVDKQGPIHPVCGQCWIWIAGKYSTGYGQHGNYRAHRYSWNLYYGEIPVGVFVLHRCDNPACVNPKHLFLGTHQDNMDDMIEKGRDNKAAGNLHWTRVKPESVARGSGHYSNVTPEKVLRGESQGMAKLTEIEVESIRSLYKTKKISVRDLSVMFNVSYMTIYRVIKRISWRHV